MDNVQEMPTCKMMLPEKSDPFTKPVFTLQSPFFDERSF